MNNVVKYLISFSQANPRWVNIHIQYQSIIDKPVFQIAAWRPGRYEEQNYAKNVRGFEVKNTNGEATQFRKSSKNSWFIDALANETLHIQYQYHAAQMDAGGCWLDEEQLYLNFVACMLYPISLEPIKYRVEVDLPKNYKMVCGKKQCAPNSFCFDSFEEMADHPMIASKSISTMTYHVEGIPFYCHFRGQHLLNIDKLKLDFEKFTQSQLDVFGSFPFDEYHFMFQLLPYPHYHGVEHRNSTVIVLGKTELISTESDFYIELLGIASHELLHTWNICKIRPAELLPYDLSKPQLFETGFVAEGFTTYLGDKYLYDSGVYSLAQYKAELNNMLMQHLHNYGNFYYSLAESSTDLWIDGYSNTTPYRKVSIYTKGAVVAWLLDTMIQMYSSKKYNLNSLMKLLWQHHQQTQQGYTSDLVLEMLKKLAGEEIENFYHEAIYARTDLKKYILQNIEWCGWTWQEKKGSASQYKYGMKLSRVKGNEYRVEQIAPQSPAEVMSIGDIIMLPFDVVDELENYLDSNNDVKLMVQQYGKICEKRLYANEKRFFETIELV